MSSVLLGGPPQMRGQTPSEPTSSTPPAPPASSIVGAQSGGEGRSSWVTVIAGVGVLLLAMGVGVLIGRSGGGSKAAPAAQVITVGTAPPSSTATGPASSEASVASDWPAGTSGYTVQLQTLPQSGTQANAVEAAKTSASSKGAKEVGGLKSEDFNSLSPGSYVIYSGVYHQRPQAEKALPGLRKSFPGAKVIKVSNGGSAGSSGASSGAAGGSGAGSSESHPAPPSVLKNLSKKKGQSYEQESKNLPNVVSTG